MIGIFVITHGDVGASIIDTVAHVLNKPLPAVRQLSVAAGDDPRQLLPVARRLISEIDGGDGVVVLTDLYGATPSNVAAMLLQPGKVEGLAGVSVPMLLRAITYRDRGLKVMLTKAVSGGRDGVMRLPVAA
jgi:PTS system ascorbate-specific IIA component